MNDERGGTHNGTRGQGEEYGGNGTGKARTSWARHGQQGLETKARPSSCGHLKQAGEKVKDAVHSGVPTTRSRRAEVPGAAAALDLGEPVLNLVSAAPADRPVQHADEEVAEVGGAPNRRERVERTVEELPAHTRVAGHGPAAQRQHDEVERGVADAQKSVSTTADRSPSGRADCRDGGPSGRCRDPLRSSGSSRGAERLDLLQQGSGPAVVAAERIVTGSSPVHPPPGSGPVVGPSGLAGTPGTEPESAAVQPQERSSTIPHVRQANRVAGHEGLHEREDNRRLEGVLLRNRPVRFGPRASVSSTASRRNSCESGSVSHFRTSGSPVSASAPYFVAHRSPRH